MDSEDLQRFLEINKLLNDSLDVTVKIRWEEALKIVVADLVSKYLYNVTRNNAEWADAFEKVLSYYLSPEDVDEIKNNN